MLDNVKPCQSLYEVVWRPQFKDHIYLWVKRFIPIDIEATIYLEILLSSLFDEHVYINKSIGLGQMEAQPKA